MRRSVANQRGPSAVVMALTQLDTEVLVAFALLASLGLTAGVLYYTLTGELPRMLRLGIALYLALCVITLVAAALLSGSAERRQHVTPAENSPDYAQEHKKLMEEYIRLGGDKIIRAGALLNEQLPAITPPAQVLARTLQEMHEDESLVVQSPFVWDTASSLLHSLHKQLLQNKKVLVICPDANAVKATAQLIKVGLTSDWTVTIWPHEYILSSVILSQQIDILIAPVTIANPLDDTLLEYLQQVKVCVVLATDDIITNNASSLARLADVLYDISGGTMQYLALTKPCYGVESAFRQLARVKCRNLCLHPSHGEKTHYILWKTEGSALSLPGLNTKYIDPAVLLTLPALQRGAGGLKLVQCDNAPINDSIDALGGLYSIKQIRKDEHVSVEPIQNFVAHDSEHNLPRLLTTWSSRSTISCLIHTLSERYLLRDYFAKYLEFFINKPYEIDRIIPFVRPTDNPLAASIPLAEIVSDDQYRSRVSIPQSQVYQNFLPGQTVKRDGRLYEVAGIKSNIEGAPTMVVLRNVPCEQNTTTRPVKRYYAGGIHAAATHSLEFAAFRVVRTTLSCNLTISNLGYYNFYSGFYLAAPHGAYVELESALTSRYNDTHLLRYVVECHNPVEVPAKISFTMAVLLNEVCRTLFPESYQYLDFCIASATRKALPDDPHSKSVLGLYPQLELEDGVEDHQVAFYVVCNNPLDTGLLEAIAARMYTHILPILSDYLSNLPEIDSDFLTYGFDSVPPCLNTDATLVLLQTITAHSKSLTSARKVFYMGRDN